MSEYGQWVWQAPSGTFIEWAEFSGSDHAHWPGGNTCAVRGIWDGHTYDLDRGRITYRYK